MVVGFRRSCLLRRFSISQGLIVTSVIRLRWLTRATESSLRTPVVIRCRSRYFSFPVLFTTRRCTRHQEIRFPVPSAQSRSTADGSLPHHPRRLRLRQTPVATIIPNC